MKVDSLNSTALCPPLDVTRLRGEAYRLFAALFIYPHRDRTAALRATARELQREPDPAAAFPFFGQWQRLLALLSGAKGVASTRIEEEYVPLFVVNPKAPPYESSYLDPRRTAAGWTTVQLTREYAQAGLILSPSFGELPDHAAVQLEFMAYLCGEAARPLQNEPAQSIQRLKRQHRFLLGHLGVWFPLFTRRVKEAAPGCFYQLVVEAAHAFIHHDMDLLSLLLGEAQM